MKLIELETLDVYYLGQYLCTLGRISVTNLPRIQSEGDEVLRKILGEVREFKRQLEADR